MQVSFEAAGKNQDISHLKKMTGSSLSRSRVLYNRAVLLTMILTLSKG